jgi:murein L,D-transpeptidase YafK
MGLKGLAQIATVVAVLSGGAVARAAQPEGDLGAATVDKILVVKSERKLYLLNAGKIVRTIDVSLGLVPNGPKQREGDFKTPEGVYYIEAKNPASDYFLSLKISYPNDRDRARARAQGVDPGSQIMIHGLPNEPKYPVNRYLGWDWTDGCIAVSNSDMVDLWLMTSVSTPIEIRP